MASPSSPSHGRPVLLPCIGGERVAGTPAQAALIPNHNPATGAVHSFLRAATKDDVDAAVRAARRALPAWSSAPLRQRTALLDRVADAIEARLDVFALAETRDQGKPVALSRSMDIPRAIDNLRFFAAAARTASDGCFAGESAAGGSFTTLTRREPVGVCALITPWNLPLYLLTWKLAPALVMGNTVVCKPSELTSTTASLLADVLHDCGCPPGVVNMLFGYGAETGQALLDHPDVDLLSFTGGTSTGQRVALAAAQGQKKVSLELGGKNASIVLADADISKAARVCARAGFLNQGQICLAGSRILVHESRYAAFLEKLCAEVASLRVGHPEDPATTLGPVVSAAHRDKVEEAVRAALASGARRLDLPGHSALRPELDHALREGYFLNPSVLVDVDPNMPIEQDETFGPVVTVSSFGDEAAAIGRANGVRYGLSAAIFTRDTATALRVSQALQCGTVWVNTWMSRDLRVPFGGIKASGTGREGGRWSLDFYSETKSIVLDHAP